MYDVNKSIDNLENFFKYGFELNYNLIDESTRWEDEFLNKNYCDDYFYHQYCLNINALYMDEDIGEGECIGEMKFKLFNIGLMDFEGINRFSEFDDIDVEFSELGSILESAEELEDRYKESNYVLYIERLCINKSMRNKGIAHRVLKQIEDIIDWYLGIEPDIIIFKSFPIEVEIKDKDSNRNTEEFDSANKKLNKLYKNCGFKCIENLGSYYFYKISDI